MNRTRIKNLFLAEPKDPHELGGIRTHPGFHTANDPVVAEAYALGRVYNESTDDYYEDIHTRKAWVTDYPVLVALDMSGLNRLIDYDADVEVRAALSVSLMEFYPMLPKNPTDDQIYEAADMFLEMTLERESSFSLSPLAYYDEYIYTVQNNPIVNIKDCDWFPEFIRNEGDDFIRNGHIRDFVLIEAVGQYRYGKDVSEKRIISTWYLPPLAQEMFVLGGTDIDEMEKIWDGFQITDEDEILGGYFNSARQLVYGPENPPDIDRLEYHGTTYKRLIRAATSIRWPKPPSPPYEG